MAGSKFPVSDGPAPKLEVCRKFPITIFSPPKLSPDEIPPPPAVCIPRRNRVRSNLILELELGRVSPAVLGSAAP